MCYISINVAPQMAALVETGNVDERRLSVLYDVHAKVIAEVRRQLELRKIALSSAWTVDDLRLLKFVLSFKTADATVAAIERASKTERSWEDVFQIAAEDLPACKAGSGDLCDLWELPEGRSADLDSVLV